MINVWWYICSEEFYLCCIEWRGRREEWKRSSVIEECLTARGRESRCTSLVCEEGKWLFKWPCTHMILVSSAFLCAYKCVVCIHSSSGDTVHSSLCAFIYLLKLLDVVACVDHRTDHSLSLPLSHCICIHFLCVLFFSLFSSLSLCLFVPSVK